MKRTLSLVSIGVALVLVLALFFSGGSLVGWLMSLRNSVDQPAGSPDLATCRAAIALLATPAGEARAQELAGSNFLNVDVYSRYPFSDRSTVTVRGGSDVGIKPGMPAFVGGYLFGTVSSVNRTQSEVETIFNPVWRSSVYVGSRRAKAVVRGGDVPVVELLARDAGVVSGDPVVNSSPTSPLGSKLGNVSDLKGGEHDLWFTSELTVPYEFDDVRSVRVLTNFP